MEYFSQEEIDNKKRAIFEAMGSRGQKKITQDGYDKWNPFEEPKHPIDIRKDKTKRTSQVLIREFLQSTKHEEYSNAFGQGALDICLGIINNDEKFLGMYAFSCWYKDLLKNEGHNTAI